MGPCLGRSSKEEKSRESSQDKINSTTPTRYIEQIHSESRTNSKILRPVYRPEASRGYPISGIRNIGNTCYINSILQCLFSNDCFVNFCFQNKKNNQLCRLIWSVYSNDPSSSRSKAIHDIQSLFQTKGFSPLRQADAHEWLRNVLQELEIEKTTSSNDSSIDELFDGKVSTIMKCCNCSETIEFEEDFFEITLNFPSASKQCDLESLISQYIGESICNFDSGICSCKYKRYNTLKLIKNHPRILILKVDRSVMTDVAIYPNARLSLENESRRKTVYVLKGIVYYNFSHYTAEVYDSFEKVWKYCNDGTVSVIEASIVERKPRKDSFLYFYEML